MTKTLMAAMVLSTILTAPVYANDICNARKDMIRIAMTLRQRGESFKDVMNLAKNTIKKTQEKNPSLPANASDEVLDYFEFAIKNAFEVPIQNVLGRREELIETFVWGAYRSCMAQISGER